MNLQKWTLNTSDSKRQNPEHTNLERPNPEHPNPECPLVSLLNYIVQNNVHSLYFIIVAILAEEWFDTVLSQIVTKEEPTT